MREKLIKKIIKKYNDEELTSFQVIDLAFEKYKQKSNNFLATAIFLCFILFTFLTQIFGKLFSGEIFELSSNKTSLLISSAKFLVEYTLEYGPILAVLLVVVIFFELRSYKNFIY